MIDPKDRIRERREALRLSQLDLSQRLGYTDRSTIAKLEAGVNHVNTKKLPALARALETTVSYLMGETDDYYDYDRDPDQRALDIPMETYEILSNNYNGNFRAIWAAFNRGEGRPPEEITPKEIKFALFGGSEGITDEMYEEVVQFAHFVRDREARKKAST